MQIYSYLDETERSAIPQQAIHFEACEWHLPVWVAELPSHLEDGPSLLQAAAGLDEEERRSLYFTLVGLANRVAVAERLPLADTESLETALNKAIEGASIGLEQLSQQHQLTLTEVLQRVPVSRLFQVGVHQNPQLRPAPTEMQSDDQEGIHTENRPDEPQ